MYNLGNFTCQFKLLEFFIFQWLWMCRSFPRERHISSLMAGACRPSGTPRLSGHSVRCGNVSEPLFYSVLSHPITLEGRRNTTDEFPTIPFHLILFSAALVELAKSIPVHSLILSSHLFFCLPLFVFPFTVPCRIVFAKPEDLETWPNHFSYRFLTRVRSSSYSPMAAWIFLVVIWL